MKKPREIIAEMTSLKTQDPEYTRLANIVMKRIKKLEMEDFGYVFIDSPEWSIEKHYEAILDYQEENGIIKQRPLKKLEKLLKATL